MKTNILDFTARDAVRLARVDNDADLSRALSFIKKNAKKKRNSCMFSSKLTDSVIKELEKKGFMHSLRDDLSNRFDEDPYPVSLIEWENGD